MKTLKHVLLDNLDKAKLIKAVIRQLGGIAYVADVVNHGAGAGFPGFIYYSDTTEFYKAHKKEINAWVSERTKELGESTISMIQNWNCLKNNGITEDEVGGVLYGNEQDTQIENALAWFALEEVCRLFED